MPLETMLRNVRVETAAEQFRANDHAVIATALLGTGHDGEAGREQYRVLDGLALIHIRQHAIEIMRGFAFTRVEA